MKEWVSEWMQEQVNEWSITQINIKGTGCYERKYGGPWKAPRGLKVGRMITVVAGRQKRSGSKACWWHKMNGTCWCTWYGGWERAQIGRWASFPQPSKRHPIQFSSIQDERVFSTLFISYLWRKAAEQSKHDFLNSEISTTDNREIRVFIFASLQVGINW